MGIIANVLPFVKLWLGVSKRGVCFTRVLLTLLGVVSGGGKWLDV